jgi:mannose-6-phosphate isomerase-like protein (cupin superfamily)
MGYSVVDLDEIDPSGPGGAVRFVRRELGASAFGINHFTLQPGAFGLEHDEAESGQEEVMFIVSGSGTLHVGGEDVELRPGRFVRLDPETTRVAQAGPEGLVFITAGAPREERYVPRGPF